MSKIRLRIRPEVQAALVNAFVNHCVEAIQIGYDMMRSENRYDVDREEDNLTICLVETIKKTPFLGQYRISVNYQSPIYTDAMAFEGANSLRAPRVDFKFSKFIGPKERDYYAEAKNLSENNWNKSDGASVKASHYRARYIDTGIENYLSGRYPEGCLLGYVVNGDVVNVVAGINNLIKTRKASPRIGLITKDPTTTMPICYVSDNQTASGPVSLRHLILQLA
jgi:hypothetical protein